MNLKQVLIIILLLFVCILVLLPYLIMTVSAFSTDACIKGGVVFNNISLENFMNNCDKLFAKGYYIPSMINSVVISIFAALIGVVVASMAGYCMVIFKSWTTNVFFTFFFVSIMIPGASLLVPTFLLAKYTGMLDTYTIVILTSMSVPFLIYLFKQSTKLMPSESIISARLEGCSEMSIFCRIYIPNVISVLIAGMMISFFNAWNSVLLPVALLQSPEKFTNTLFLNGLGAFWNVDYGMLMVALVLSTLPQIIIFLLCSRHLKSLCC